MNVWGNEQQNTNYLNSKSKKENVMVNWLPDLSIFDYHRSKLFKSCVVKNQTPETTAKITVYIF
jgi:hypothetical protein